MEIASPDEAGYARASFEDLQHTPLDRIGADQVTLVIDRIIGREGDSLIVSSAFQSSI